jgi:hypothetical protein
MMTNEKIKQVRKLLKRGVPAGELITDLKEEGFSDEEIDTVFRVSRKSERRVILESSFLSLVSISFIIAGGTILLGPPFWLRPYGYFILIAGLLGIVVRRFMASKTKR